MAVRISFFEDSLMQANVELEQALADDVQSCSVESLEMSPLQGCSDEVSTCVSHFECQAKILGGEFFLNFQYTLFLKKAVEKVCSGRGQSLEPLNTSHSQPNCTQGRGAGGTDLHRRAKKIE